MRAERARPAARLGRSLSLSSESSQPLQRSATGPALWRSASRQRRPEARWLTCPRTESPSGRPGRLALRPRAVAPVHLLLTTSSPSENTQSPGSAPSLLSAAGIGTEMLSLFPESWYTKRAVRRKPTGSTVQNTHEPTHAFQKCSATGGLHHRFFFSPHRIYLTTRVRILRIH